MLRRRCTSPDAREKKKGVLASDTRTIAFVCVAWRVLLVTEYCSTLRLAILPLAARWYRVTFVNERAPSPSLARAFYERFWLWQSPHELHVLTASCGATGSEGELLNQPSQQLLCLPDAGELHPSTCSRASASPPGTPHRLEQSPWRVSPKEWHERTTLIDVVALRQGSSCILCSIQNGNRPSRLRERPYCRAELYQRSLNSRIESL